MNSNFHRLFFKENMHVLKQKYNYIQLQDAKDTISHAIDSLNTMLSIATNEEFIDKPIITNKVISQASWVASELNGLRQCLDYFPIKENHNE